MKFHLISYSATNEHSRELMHALGLSSIPRIIDISDSLIAARKHINPFRIEQNELTTGQVILISDFPLTGKSCLAYNLANDWLNASIALNEFTPSVLVIKPEWQSAWTREQIQREIELRLPASHNHINALVIIDDLENMAATDEDARDLFSLFLNSEHAYHKLLIHNKGRIDDPFGQNIIEEFRELYKSGFPEHLLFEHMVFSAQDLTKLVHLDSYLQSGYFQLAEIEQIESRATKISEEIAIEPNESHRYLIGMISSILHSVDSSSESRYEKLYQTQFFKALHEDFHVKVLLNILVQLHCSWELSNNAGFSNELIGALYTKVANNGWPEYERTVSKLAGSNLVIINATYISVPEIFFKAIVSAKNLAESYSLEEHITNAKVQSQVAKLQLGMLYLHWTDYINAIGCFSQCVDPTLQERAIKALTSNIFGTISESEFHSLSEAQHISITISHILQNICTLFRSVSPDDYYKQYEDALERLQELVSRQPNGLPDVELLVHQLLNNIVDAKQFGDTESKRAERNKIVYTLDKYTRQVLNVSFYHLFKQTTPSTLPKVIEQLAYLSEADKTGMLPLVIDSVVEEACKRIKNLGIAVWQTFDAWVQFITLGNCAKDFLMHDIFEQMLLSDSIETENIISFIDRVEEKLGIRLSVREIIQLLLFRGEKYTQKEKIVLSRRIIDVRFPNINLEPSLLITHELWYQSVESALTILKNSYLPNDEKFDWLSIIFEETSASREKLARHSAPLLHRFTLDILFSPEATEDDVSLYLGYLSNTGSLELNSLFQLYSAINTCIVLFDTRWFALRYLENAILALGNRFTYSIGFQLGLASYLLWIQQLCKFSSISQDQRELLNSHRTSLRQSLEALSDAFYVRDKLQWGQNYGDVIASFENSIAETLQMDAWPEYIGLSYVGALQVYRSAEAWEDVNSLKNEGLAFCSIYEISGSLYSSLSDYKASSQTKPETRNNSYRSEYYGLDQSRWGQIIRGIQVGQYTQIIEFLSQNLRVYHTCFEIWYLLGLCYLRIFDDLTAAICFDRSLKLAPKYINSYLQIAYIHSKLSHTEEEIEILSQASEIGSKHFDVALRLAKAHQKENHLDEAITYFERAAGLIDEHTKDYRAVIKELVILHKQKHQWEKALDWCWEVMHYVDDRQEILLVFQDVFKARMSSSPPLTYSKKDIRYFSTIQYLLEVLQEGDISDALRPKIASAYFKMGDYTKAWAVISKLTFGTKPIDSIIQIMSDAECDEDVAFYQGIVYYQRGLFEEAAVEWSKVIQKSPDNYEAHYNFALANLASAKINSKLKLGESLIQTQQKSAVRSGFAALFYGHIRAEVWNVLGSYYFIKASDNDSFNSLSLKCLEESCIENPTIDLIVSIMQSKFAGIEAQQPDNTVKFQSWLTDIKEKILDPLQTYIDKTRNVYNSHFLSNYLGSICLQICQLSRQRMDDETYKSLKLSEYFYVGQIALENAVDSDGAVDTQGNKEINYVAHKNLGNLFWEWQFLLSSLEQINEKLESAIQHWEKALELMRGETLSRLNRTLREEIEISIGAARKKIKTISDDSI